MTRSLRPALAASALTGVAVLATATAAHAQPAPVEVTNPVTDPANVVPVADTMPVIETVYVVAGAPDTSASGSFTSVPAGYRLVIDHVGYSVTAQANQRAYVLVRPCPNLKNNTWGVTSIPSTVFSNADGLYVNLGLSPMHLYADAGCVPQAIALRNGTTGNFGGHITLQGHHVKLPPARAQ